MKPIWPWLFPLAVVASSIYLFRNYMPWKIESGDSMKWLDFAMGTLMTIVVATLAGGAGCGLSWAIGEYCFTQEWEKSWTADMVSMRSADGIKGSMAGGGLFMMSGQVGSSQVYYYYTSNNDGSYQPRKWSPDGSTRVFEEDRHDGKVIQWRRVFKHPIVQWIGWVDDDWRAMDFHIPKGSLRKSFSLE